MKRPGLASIGTTQGFASKYRILELLFNDNFFLWIAQYDVNYTKSDDVRRYGTNVATAMEYYTKRRREQISFFPHKKVTILCLYRTNVCIVLMKRTFFLYKVIDIVDRHLTSCKSIRLVVLNGYV
jgi:hypothetical protein